MLIKSIQQLKMPDMNDLSNWQPCTLPPLTPMEGHYARLVPIIDEQYFDDLQQAYSADVEGRIWDYLPYGPFATKDEFFAFARSTYLGKDPMFHALLDQQTGKALGVASLMRINNAHGVIEVGHICHSPAAQQRPMTTEAIYLFGRRVFEELGYRRFEWKCNAANQASTRAAERLGFTFEGIFRQTMVVKGRNRDTAWYSMIDSEWPAIKAGFKTWLNEDNFDKDGRQIHSLKELRG